MTTAPVPEGLAVPAVSVTARSETQGASVPRERVMAALRKRTRCKREAGVPSLARR
jgi:hypothetical protein